MRFSLTCRCGADIAVSAASCGADVACRCGNRIVVPSLSELRRSAGLSAFDLTIADRIRWLGLNNRLPQEPNCLLCGSPTPRIWNCFVECERPIVRKQTGWLSWLAAAVLPIWDWGQQMHRWNDVTAHGSELVVPAPLRICDNCFGSRRKSKNWRRNVVTKSPLYKDLLVAYPGADIHLANELSGNRP